MIDDRLRTALHELGDVSPPPDLAGSALVRVRRDRRRTAAGLLVAVALLVAGAIAVPALVLGRPTPEQAATAVPSGLMITGYSTVADPDTGRLPKVSNGPSAFYPPGGVPAVYSRARGSYVKVPWQIALPSPDGHLLAVSTAGVKKDVGVNGRLGIVPADRVDDAAAVRWLPGVETSGWIGWAPDSKRVFYVVDTGRAPDPAEVQGRQFHVVDVGTLADRPATLAVPEDDLLIDSVPVVPPGGQAYALSLGHRSRNDGAPARETVRYYDDRGVRTADVTAVGVGPFPHQAAQPFSPSGRLVALGVGDETDIADAKSGRVVRRHVDGSFAGWYDDTRIVVAAGRSVRVVEVATGRVVAQKQVAPAGQRLVNVWLAPLIGPLPPGAVKL